MPPYASIPDGDRDAKSPVSDALFQKVDENLDALNAALQLLGFNRAFITATTTWTVPAGINTVRVRMWAGGGGSGSGASAAGGYGFGAGPGGDTWFQDAAKKARGGLGGGPGVGGAPAAGFAPVIGANYIQFGTLPGGAQNVTTGGGVNPYPQSFFQMLGAAGGVGMVTNGSPGQANTGQAGGGGGGADGLPGGNPGSHGEMAEYTLPVTPGDIIDVHIGAGGAGGADPGFGLGNGGAGGSGFMVIDY